MSKASSAMDLNIKTSSNEKIILEYGKPEHVPYRLPGGDTWSLNNELGVICFEELQTGDYTIRSCYIRLAKKKTLYFNSENPLAGLRIALHNRWSFGIQGNKKVNLQKNQFLLYYSGKKGEKIVFDKNKEYLSFEVFCKPQKLAEHFSTCARFKNTAVGNEPFIQFKPLWAPYEVIHMIYNLPGNYVCNDLRPIFNYLIQRMNDSLDREEPLKREMLAARTAREIILNDLSVHFTIDKIAKKVGLNEFRLKYVFREVFDTSIYQYLLNERMRKAKYLLETTDLSMKDVAEAIGYRFLTSFITSFHKFYNFTPRFVQRPAKLQVVLQETSELMLTAGLPEI